MEGAGAPEATGGAAGAATWLRWWLQVPGRPPSCWVQGQLGRPTAAAHGVFCVHVQCAGVRVTLAARTCTARHQAPIRVSCRGQCHSLLLQLGHFLVHGLRVLPGPLLARALALHHPHLRQPLQGCTQACCSVQPWVCVRPQPPAAATGAPPVAAAQGKGCGPRTFLWWWSYELRCCSNSMAFSYCLWHTCTPAAAGQGRAWRRAGPTSNVRGS